MKLHKGLIAVGVAAALVGGLTGCSSNPSVAAIVNGEEIPQSLIQSYVEGCSTAMNVRASETEMTAWAVQAQLGKQLAQQQGVEVSDAEREEYLAELQNQVRVDELEQNPACAQALYGVVDHNVAVIKIDDQALIKNFYDQSQITVNPRNGAWSPDDYQVVASTGSLAQLLNQGEG